MSPGPRNATAVALDAVETHSIDRGQLLALRTDHEQVDQILLGALVTEVRRLAQQLVEVMYVPAEKRVWRRVLDLSVAFGSETEPAAKLPLTQDVIAQLTGCTRPTANRVLRAGVDAALIRMSRGRIEILDIDGIRRFAR